MADNKGQKKRFKLFDFNREGPGISKKVLDENKSGLKRFFTTFINNFTKILYVNIFFVVGNFPVFFLIAAIAGFTQVDSSIPVLDVFHSLAPVFSNNDPSGFSMTLYALTGLQDQVLVPTVWTYVFYGIGALTLFTFGFVNVGTAYILRNIAKGDPVFVWSDFWYAIKRNWKQALPFGIIDILINAILIGGIYLLVTGGTSFFASLIMWIDVVIFVLYFFMRFYIYIQIVTFRLSIFKILKNSLILALYGFKRNILAFLGIAVLLGLEFASIFAFNGIFVSLGVGLPLLILFSAMAYMKVYAAYFKIKEVMIDPYNAEHPEEAPTVEQSEEEEDEVIMRDDVTERERIAEIRRQRGLPPDED